MITVCTLTYNRDTCLSRLLRSYLEQDYKQLSTLLVFNSGRETSLPDLELPDYKNIILVNRQNSIVTGKPYSSVGEKHTDMLTYIPSGTRVITHSDVDDIFFSNHISEGMKGMERAYDHNRLAYKPKKSYFKSAGGVFRNENVYEPSIFVDLNHIYNSGFHSNSVVYHSKWLQPLIETNKILVDAGGISTFCYDWGGIPVYKMSGRGEDNDDNFNTSQMVERDFGTGLTLPSPSAEYYAQCDYILKNFKEL